jgi:hypothetical protein
VQVVAVFCATKEAHSVLSSNSGEVHASGERAAALTLLKTFWDSAAHATDVENNFCDERCKLIPSIEEGGWAIKMAVGQKPVLLGKKIHQAYHRGPNYLEIDIDISSSTIASNILGMVSCSLPPALVLYNQSGANLSDLTAGSWGVEGYGGGSRDHHTGRE